MKLWQPIACSFPLSILSSLSWAAFASTLELNILPTLDSTGQCPNQLIAYETLSPYTEGGYSREGMIQLGDIATDIEMAGSDSFSITWLGSLKTLYRDCQATAIINRIDGEAYTGHSYLQLRLVDGQAAVVLDMTGIPDANGFTSTLLSGTMRDGNPRWIWGGTD